jgi:hypothetical protein
MEADGKLAKLGRFDKLKDSRFACLGEAGVK